VTVRKGNNFRSDCWIAIKLLLEFPDALLHGVDEESIVDDDEVWSSQAGWTVRKRHNFRSDRWIAIKLLMQFPDALFHGVDGESILGDDEVWSSKAGWTVRDTTKRLMSSPKCRSVEVINNPARPGSNHREVYCINYS